MKNKFTVTETEFYLLVYAKNGPDGRKEIQAFCSMVGEEDIS